MATGNKWQSVLSDEFEKSVGVKLESTFSIMLMS